MDATHDQRVSALRQGISTERNSRKLSAEELNDVLQQPHNSVSDDHSLRGQSDLTAVTVAADQKPSANIRVLVVDDHPVVRGCICHLLQAESQFEIVCEAITGTEAIAKAKEHQPDVILLDLSLPDMGGLEVTRRIKRVAPSAGILILSEHDGPIVQEAFRAGARGYLLKSDSPGELVMAVRTVNDCQRYLSARFAQVAQQSISSRTSVVDQAEPPHQTREDRNRKPMQAV